MSKSFCNFPTDAWAPAWIIADCDGAEKFCCQSAVSLTAYGGITPVQNPACRVLALNRSRAQDWIKSNDTFNVSLLIRQSTSLWMAEVMWKSFKGPAGILSTRRICPLFEVLRSPMRTSSQRQKLRLNASTFLLGKRAPTLNCRVVPVCSFH